MFQPTELVQKSSKPFSLKRTVRLASTLTIAALISACSGGGSGSTSNPNASAGSAQSNQFISNFSDTEDISAEAEGSCTLNDFEVLLLQAINNARSLPQLCGEEQMPPTNPVEWNCELLKAATQHSNDMADNNFFAHQGSDGLRVNHRVDATDYDWSRVGENIAAGYPGIDLVMQAWLDSPSHCTTLMNGSFEDVAVSLSFPESGDYDIYWTMVLASPF